MCCVEKYILVLIVLSWTMAGFTENALIRKLQDLNSSQQSIQTLSLWLIHHRKHHAAVVKTWFKELMKGKCVHFLIIWDNTSYSLLISVNRSSLSVYIEIHWLLWSIRGEGKVHVATPWYFVIKLAMFGFLITCPLLR